MNRYQQSMAAWPGLQPYVRTVQLARNGLSLHVYEAGSPNMPAALLIHGLGDEADTWRHVFEPLSAKYHVVALDLPGFGRSDPSPNAYTAPFLCDTILDLMDTLSIPQATLIGSSLGAVLSHFLALEYAERVSKLVLVDGALLSHKQPLNLSLLLFLIPGIGEWMYTRLRKNPQTAFETLRGYYADLDALPEADREFLFQRVNERVWSDKQRHAYFSVLRNFAGWVTRQQRDLSERLADLKIPTLVVWGEQDHIADVENGRVLVKGQSSARLVTLPEAGHLPHQEAPEAFLREVLESV